MNQNVQQEEISGLTITWKAYIGQCLNSTGVWLMLNIATENPFHSHGQSAFKPMKEDPEVFSAVALGNTDFSHPTIAGMKALALQDALVTAKAIAALVPALESITPAVVPGKAVAA